MKKLLLIAAVVAGSYAAEEGRIFYKFDNYFMISTYVEVLPSHYTSCRYDEQTREISCQDIYYDGKVSEELSVEDSKKRLAELERKFKEQQKPIKSAAGAIKILKKQGFRE